MRLRQRRRDEPEINLTPLIDIVFLMLIFFMVSTTFIKEAELKVSLPQASAQPSAHADKAIELTINGQGSYSLGGQRLPNEPEGALRRALAQRLGGRNPQDVELVIRADRRTQHRHVVAALDAAGRAGLQHVAIATIAPDHE